MTARCDGCSPQNSSGGTGILPQFKKQEKFMSVVSEKSRPERGRSRFLSVAEQADELGVSEVTLYRAIKAGEFPAVRIRGRLIIPVGAVQAMIDAALAGGTAVDAANWVVVERKAEA